MADAMIEEDMDLLGSKRQQSGTISTTLFHPIARPTLLNYPKD